MSIIDKAAAIGGGVIGAGWVARLLLNGIDVSIFDPDPEAARKVGEVMKGARRAYKQMLPERPAEGGQADLRQDHRRGGRRMPTSSRKACRNGST